MLNQARKSLKDAVTYIKNPENKGKPIDRLLLETGKIVIAGVIGVGALALGEVIEKGLMAVPIFAFEIPLLGNLANIIGMILGAVVAGIIGAIAINLLDKIITKKIKSNAQAVAVDKGNQILYKQHQLQNANELHLKKDKSNVLANISGRHQKASRIMRDSFGNIMEDFMEDYSYEDVAYVVDEKDVKTITEIDKSSDDLDDLIASLM